MDGSLPRAAVLMCHAPIVIPAIGRERTQDCAATTAAMREAAQAAIRSGAETLLLLSPHTPRHRRSYGYVTGEFLRGDFRSFGFHGLERTFRADAAAAAAVFRQAGKAGLPMDPTPIQALDHGALVPLYFLEEAGFKGRVAVFAFPWESTLGESRSFGRVLTAAMRDLDRTWALIASGDMSHALQPGAPAGFHPDAQVFDEAVVACVREGRLGDLQRIDPTLRNLAAEDVVESLEAALGVLGADQGGLRVLSYEAPFGVGYLVAILREGGP
jgi:MEMO1 family protein